MAGKNILCSTKEDIWMAVRRRGNQIAANMTDQEFFDNDAFRNYAGKLAEFILRNGKSKHQYEDFTVLVSDLAQRQNQLAENADKHKP